MRKLIYGLLVSLAAVATSCDSASSLANKIQGTWSGAPQRLTDNLANDITIINTFSFTLDEGTKGGTFIINSMISASGVISQAQGLEQPFSLTAAASANAMGTWVATDDDEVNIVIDPQSIDVQVDPDAVVLSNNMLTNVTTASVDSVKPHIVMLLHGALKRSISTYFMEIHKIDDIKIHDSVMEIEINDSHFTMKRQGPISKI